jgi:anti-sigma B factor antagonist
MNKPSATLMVALFDHAVCVRIAGRANFTSSLDLRKLVTELFDRGYRKFVLDLSECVLMDSTFLGVLAGIGLKFAGNGAANGEVQLLNPNARIADLLENLGVAHLFKPCDIQVPGGDFQAVASDADHASRVEVTRTCLEAHQTLMNVNPDNVRKFKDVAQFLAEDLKKLEHAVEKPPQ